MRWQGLLVLAIAAGLLAATFTYRYLGRFGEAVPVVVAARDLPAPLRLTEGDLRLEPMPLPLVHRLAFTDVGALVGRYLLYPAAAGQVLLDPQLARPGADGPVSARLAPNTVAFFVPLAADRALGGAVGEGDRVDLIVAPSGSSWSAGAVGGMAHALVRGARVLEVRDEAGRRYEADGHSAPAGLLLEVHEDEAARLAWAVEQGAVFAVLRPQAAAVDGPPGQGGTGQ